MPLTPQITLTIDLKDFSDVEIGSAGSPAYVEIALCAFGPFLPRVPGTAMMAKPGPKKFPYLGSPITVTLFGNDVIIPNAPLETYYMISIIDDQGNVVQSGAYVFTGTAQTPNLADLSPFFPTPVSPTVTGGLASYVYSASPIFNCALVSGPIAFDMVLTGDVTSSTLINAAPGQIVSFILSQDGTGSHAFSWPSNVKNHGIIDPAALSVTTQMFVARANGNLYPVGPQTYS